MRAFRGRAGAGQFDAIALGVLVGLLIPAVARLISTGDVLLAHGLVVIDSDARALVSSIGPVLIQNLVAALVILTYIVGLRVQRVTDTARSAPLFAIGLALYGIAEGLGSATGSLPISSFSLTFAACFGLSHLCRGAALAAAPAQYPRALGWLVAAALLGGPLGFFGTTAARTVGFDLATWLAVPLWVCSVTLLVILISQLTANRMRQLPPAGFVAGLGIVLASARLIGATIAP